MTKDQVWGPQKDRLLRFLVESDEARTAAECAEHLGRTFQYTYFILAQLRELGVVRRARRATGNQGRGAKWVWVFWPEIRFEDVLAEACPKCGTSPGSVCWSSVHANLWPHGARFRAAVARATA